MSVAAPGCTTGKHDKEYRERIVEVGAYDLTSCFIRHLPSSVSSALAGGVTSVAIASSSAEQSKGRTVNMASQGLRATQGGTARTKLGARRQRTELVCWHNIPLQAESTHPLWGRKGTELATSSSREDCAHPPLLGTLRISCSNMLPVNPTAHLFLG